MSDAKDWTDPTGLAVRVAHVEIGLVDHETRVRLVETWIAEARGAWRGVSLAAGLAAAVGGGIVSVLTWWLSKGL